MLEFQFNNFDREEVTMRQARPLRNVIGLWICLAGAPMVSAIEESAGVVAIEKEKTPEWVQLPLSVSKETLARVFAVPPIKTADEFTFTVLVPPRTQLHDPFDLHVVDDQTVWVADDAKSGAIFKVMLDGHVAVLADIKKHSPISLDLAPPSFGKFAGQIYTVAFAKPEKAGGWELPDAITRIDPATGRDTVICFLPENAAHEPGAGGFFARFGPENGPFAGKLWITAASNHTLYQVTPDGACKPFITIDLEKWGSPRGIGFTPDGKTMLLGSAAPAPGNRAKTLPAGGRILRVSPDGTVAAQPFVGGLHEPGAMAYAPKRFGRFAGELFISDAGDWNNEVEATESVPSDGRVYRVTPDGKLVLVASGFANPVGVAFVGDALIVSDINGDFHIGSQKFADGFMVMIKAR